MITKENSGRLHAGQILPHRTSSGEWWLWVGYERPLLDQWVWRLSIATFWIGGPAVLLLPLIFGLEALQGTYPVALIIVPVLVVVATGLALVHGPVAILDVSRSDVLTLRIERRYKSEWLNRWLGIRVQCHRQKKDVTTRIRVKDAAPFREVLEIYASREANAKG